MLRMYTLCLAGIVGLGLGSTGCGSGGRGSGDFDAAWDFGSGAGCADVGVTEVDLDWLNLRTNLSDGATFPCTAYGGTSPPLLDDDYTVALRAYTSASSTTPLSTADYGGAVYSIFAGTTTFLPPVTFAVHH
jgi:hypothetical protein